MTGEKPKDTAGQNPADMGTFWFTAESETGSGYTPHDLGESQEATIPIPTTPGLAPARNVSLSGISPPKIELPDPQPSGDTTSPLTVPSTPVPSRIASLLAGESGDPDSSPELEDATVTLPYPDRKNMTGPTEKIAVPGATEDDSTLAFRPQQLPQAPAAADTSGADTDAFKISPASPAAPASPAQAPVTPAPAEQAPLPTPSELPVRRPGESVDRFVDKTRVSPPDQAAQPETQFAASGLPRRPRLGDRSVDPGFSLRLGSQPPSLPDPEIARQARTKGRKINRRPPRKDQLFGDNYPQYPPDNNVTPDNPTQQGEQQ